MKRHDPLPADSVTLYEKGAPIPASARKIGELTISSTGAETGKRYWQAVDQAVCATADAGGNALWLDELSETVSQHGTTYALNAAMFRIDSPDIAHPTAADPLPKAHGLKEGTENGGSCRLICSIATSAQDLSPAISKWRPTEHPTKEAPSASPTMQTTISSRKPASEPVCATPVFE